MTDPRKKTKRDAKKSKGKKGGAGAKPPVDWLAEERERNEIIAGFVSDADSEKEILNPPTPPRGPDEPFGIFPPEPPKPPEPVPEKDPLTGKDLVPVPPEGGGGAADGGAGVGAQGNKATVEVTLVRTKTLS